MMFVNSLKGGDATLRAIQEELRNLENKQMSLENEIKNLEFSINETSNYVVDGALLKKYLLEFKEIFQELSFEEQNSLLHLLIREIVYYGDKIKISLWDLPNTGLSLSKSVSLDKLRFAGMQTELPGLDSNQRPSG